MKQAQKHKKVHSSKNNKNFICLQQINNLKLLKQKLEKLPTNINYLPSQETFYLRLITQILDVIAKIRLEQIEYVVSQQNLKKILVQLNNQSQHKQIILSLLKYILKGIEIYRRSISSELYQILDFLIEIEDLSISQSNQISIQSDKSIMRRQVMSISVMELIQSILRWYCMGNKPCEVREKYSKLRLKMQKHHK